MYINDKQIFEKSLPGAPLAAEILENGNILTGTTNAKKVLEMTPDGKVIWECAGLSNNVVASPVFEDGVVYVGSSYDTQAFLAIKVSGAKFNSNEEMRAFLDALLLEAEKYKVEVGNKLKFSIA